MARSSGTSPSGEDTFPKILLRNASAFGDRTAFREKAYGIWQSWTWSEVCEEIRAFSIGLKSLGLETGDKIAIVGANRPRLYWSMVAAQALGAVPVPVYSDSVAEEMAYVLGHAEVKFAVVEDQEQVDKLLSMSDEVPTLKDVIYDEIRGLRDYDHTHLHSYETIQEKGRSLQAENGALAGEWEQGFVGGKGPDVAVMLYTSGTTGRPKGVMLSYANLAISARNANLFDHLDETEDVLAYLPMAWIGDHVFSLAPAFTAAYCVNCPEGMDTIDVDRREIAPTYFFAPPRIFETLRTSGSIRMEDASAFKKQLYDRYMGLARRVGPDLLDGKSVGLGDRIGYWLGEMLVFGPLKNALGLSRVRIGYTAGEAIGPEIFAFYRSLGSNLKQLYGQTEASVFVTIQPAGEVRDDTVGVPAPGVELKINENGEVYYRSPGVFVEYYKNPEATADTKDAEGWVATGDAGFIQFLDGTVRIGQISRINTALEPVLDAEASEQKIRAGIAPLIPALAAVPGQWRACRVAFSQDGLPLAGAVPGVTGAYVFSGFTSPFALVPASAVHFAEAVTTYGVIGCKAWIYKGLYEEGQSDETDSRAAGGRAPARGRR